MAPATSFGEELEEEEEEEDEFVGDADKCLKCLLRTLSALARQGRRRECSRRKRSRMTSSSSWKIEEAAAGCSSSSSPGLNLLLFFLLFPPPLDDLFCLREDMARAEAAEAKREDGWEDAKRRSRRHRQQIWRGGKVG